MKIVWVVFAVALIACCATARSATETPVAAPEPTWPTTVDEAVVVLKKWFAPADLEWIRNTPKNNVVAQLHFPFGNGVRRDFGLWGLNKELLASCGDDFAEACSDIIFGALWESVQKDRPASPSEPTWPKTVDEAVTVLKKWFTAEDLEWIRTNPKNYVMSYLHFPFGIGVLNEFGLWGQNRDLLASCGDDFAEACSDIIYAALWESVQKDGSPKK